MEENTAKKGERRMPRARKSRGIRLYAALLLLAGLANLFSRTHLAALDTLLACVSYVIYIALLLGWAESVRIRLLPTPARRSVLSAAFLMLLYMLLRVFKYRFAVDTAPIRYVVYAYWLPQTLIPTLFLMTALRVFRGGNGRRRAPETLLLIPAGLLCALAMTNDLHFLVYLPRVELNRLILDTGTYSRAGGFYLLYVWMILCVACGLILLFGRAGRMSKKAVRPIACAAALWFGLVLVHNLSEKLTEYRMYNVPEAHIFGMLGVFEACIRVRLIPCNENYTVFFRKLEIPALITDREYRPAYRTETALAADSAAMRSALEAPFSLSPDLKLYGKPIRAGYAFWAVDESAAHRAQRKLQEANELLGQENDLIRAETEQKEKEAYLQSRHRIYHEIAGALYPCQKRISRILNGAVPGEDAFPTKIAAVSVLNAYVKRKSNLLLLAAEHERLSIRELFLALQESANYLTLSGLRTTVGLPEEKEVPAGRLAALYDAFEAIAEQLMGKAPSLMVTFAAKGLRLAAEADFLPETENISLPVRFRSSEGILYADILSESEGEKA